MESSLQAGAPTEASTPHFPHATLGSIAGSGGYNLRYHIMVIVGSILTLAIYFTIYAIVHSWLASKSVKNWARRQIGPAADRWYRLIYNIFAVITLLPMLAMIAWLPDKILYLVSSPWRWLMGGGQLLALLAAVWTLWQTDLFYFIGLAQLVAGEPTKIGCLKVDGFYRWMRHPLYTFSLVFLWLTPIMTVNLLTACILSTLYFYFGSIYEERRLVAEFGSSYEAYRRQTPRLIPLPGRRYIPPGGLMEVDNVVPLSRRSG